MSYIWEERLDLKGSELYCAIAIADHADADGRCFPGIKTIAMKMRLKERQVQNLIHRLEAKNVFNIEHGNGRGNLTSFQFKRVQENTPFSEQERVQVSTIKGASSYRERVQENTGTEIALNNRNEPFIEPLINRVNHARENADFFPQCEPAKIFTEIYGFTLPIHTETILAEEQISAPDLWRQILTDAKAGMTSAQLESANYVGRQIQYALKDYRRDVGKLTNGAKQNGQFKSAREKSNQTAIENYAFLDELDNFANSQESELYGKNSADYKLLT